MWHNMSFEETARRQYVDIKEGLSRYEAEKRLKENGKNKLEEAKHDSFLKRFISQFNDYMIIVLLISAAVSFGISFLQGDVDFIDPIIILGIVILNAFIGVIQESKAEKALEALKKMSAPAAKVKRGGIVEEIPVENIVCGDIIFLEAGDIVPADARIIQAQGLKTDEAALTGESSEVSKHSNVIKTENVGIGDMKNMVWQSSVVTAGRASAVTVATGMDTQTGKIAEMLISSSAPPTPLQEKLAKVGKTLAIGALGICFVIFLIGILHKIPAFDMFMTSVSLAVAAIPEGLPAIVTVMLSIGVQRMAKQNAIIRKMPAVETLGSATVICSDKTGTLTQNKMTVTEYYGDKKQILSLCSLCSNNSGATERALMNAAEGIDLSEEYPRVSEIPFDSKRKLMTTIHKTENGYRVITKGAPEILLEKCSISPLKKRQAEESEKKMASKALRVIGVAYKDVKIMPENPERDLTFAGLAGMTDPPRPEVREAVKTCRRAGIKPVMITGDYIETAVATAKELGIYTEGSRAVSGKELDAMSDECLSGCINECSVFARVTPEHKVRIVKAFQKKDNVVAMTGDGVNDAPALKIADIGCAMGKTGTDVAKGTADMVLTDDNFATIVSAVREGRGIYANIKKAVHFLLSSNIGEILTIFVAIFLGWQAPLIAIQLLWVNLITDSLPAIALGMEKPDKYIMDEKPIKRQKGFFSDGLAFAICIEGVMIGMIALLAFVIGQNVYGSLETARTLAFASLSISQLIHAFDVRSERSLFKIGIFSNAYLSAAFVICVALQIAVITVPALAMIFKVTTLTLSQWGVVALLSVVPFVATEGQKLIDALDMRFKKRAQVNLH